MKDKIRDVLLKFLQECDRKCAFLYCPVDDNYACPRLEKVIEKIAHLTNEAASENIFEYPDMLESHILTSRN